MWSVGVMFYLLLTGEYLCRPTSKLLSNPTNLLRTLFSYQQFRPELEDLMPASDCQGNQRLLQDVLQHCTTTIDLRSKFHNWKDNSALSALDLLTQMLKFNPSRRVTAEQALLHPFLDEIGKRHLHQYMNSKPTTLPPLRTANVLDFLRNECSKLGLQ